MLLSTPVGQLFPLALLTILGGTLFIGIISSKRKEREERLHREAEHKELLRKKSFHRKLKIKRGLGVIKVDDEK